MHRRLVSLGVVIAAWAIAVLAPLATATLQAKPKLVGNPDLGGLLYNNVGCATCHDYSGIGPSLAHLALTEKQIYAEVAEGGSTVMGAAASKYRFTMQGFEDSLSTAQIYDISAYVYDQAHPLPGSAAATGG
jgi:cytochrome c553